MENPAILSAHYLPCVQWFAHYLHNNARIEQYENYNKSSYRNRCHIVGANGLLRLSIPLEKGKHQQMPMREVRVCGDSKWRREHWQSIRSAYGKTPYFPYYADELAPVFTYGKGNELLFHWNMRLIRKLLELLGHPTPPHARLTETYERIPPERDLRRGITPKPAHKIEDPLFIPVEYPQAFAEKHGFIPNVSVLDLLFCTGPEAAGYIQESFVGEG